MNWQRQKVLVTGAGGFIGSHLAERLVELGADVTAMVHYNALGSWGWLDTSPPRKQMRVIAGDVRDRDSVREAVRGAEVVFHLAALIAIPYSYSAPFSYVQTNVEGTLNVLQAAREAGVKRMVHTSTSEVYGTARYVPINEEHALAGQSPYSASKIGADKMAEAFHLSFDVPVATIRPFNTFGPRQSARAVIPTIITQALTQPEVRLGNLEATRDLNYVADTVEGFLAIAASTQTVGQVTNIGSGREISIGDLAKLILKLLGKSVPVVCEETRLRPPGSEVDRLCADNTRARQTAGWTPAHTLEQGLEKTIAWVEKNLERYRSETYVV